MESFLREHKYAVSIKWTGNTGTGTSHWRAYERAHDIASTNDNKPVIPGSSDPSFHGDRTRWNPEELLVASLSACHKLFFLRLCSDAGVVVTAYVDNAEGWMNEDPAAGGKFTRVLLRPTVTLKAGSDVDRARSIHTEANRYCFIANSVNFPVDHESEFRFESD